MFRNYLARRLLQDKSEDMEAEKLIITNMKVSCGMAQIKNLEGMMADIQTAKEEAKAYEETMSFKQQTFDYKVQCLTTANWPTYKSIEVPLPPHIETHCKAF